MNCFFVVVLQMFSLRELLPRCYSFGTAHSLLSIVQLWIVWLWLRLGSEGSAFQAELPPLQPRPRPEDFIRPPHPHLQRQQPSGTPPPAQNGSSSADSAPSPSHVDGSHWEEQCAFAISVVDSQFVNAPFSTLVPKENAHQFLIQTC